MKENPQHLASLLALGFSYTAIYLLCNSLVWIKSFGVFSVYSHGHLLKSIDLAVRRVKHFSLARRARGKKRAWVARYGLLEWRNLLVCTRW